MDKITAYQRGHFRILGHHALFHTMSDLYWVKFFDAVGIWTVPVHD